MRSTIHLTRMDTLNINHKLVIGFPDERIVRINDIVKTVSIWGTERRMEQDPMIWNSLGVNTCHVISNECVIGPYFLITIMSLKKRTESC